MEKDLDFDDEEFAETEAEESHLKGGLIALVVIASILSLIGLSIVLLTPSHKSPEFHNENFEINEILNNEFKPHLFNGTWISGHEFLYKHPNESLVLFDAKTNNISTILVHSFITRQFDTQRYSLSSDKSFVLLISDYRKSINFVFTANFIIYDIKNGNIIHLQQLLEDQTKISIQWAEWAPVGNALVFINNNDIYYVPYIGGKVKSITNNGKEGVVFNGIVDLLYRESISPKESMLWWASDGTALCYTTIDNSGVGDNTIVYYGSLHNDSDSASLKYIKYKYPKAHQNIPKTSLWIYSFNTSLAKQLIPPKGLLNKDFYVTFVNCGDGLNVTVVFTPRHQNHSIISTCAQSDDWMCKEVIKMSNAVSLKMLSQSILPAPDDGLTYYTICLRPDSVDGSYYHISSFRLDEKFIETFITYGVYDVTKLLFINKSMLYFVAKQSINGFGRQQHIYRVTIDSTPQNTVQCMTCQLNSITSSDTECHYFDAHFSTNGDYYALQCLGPDVPKVWLLNTNQPNIAFELDANEALVDKMHHKLQLKQQIFTVVSQHKKVYIKLLFPHEFDDEVIDKYSLIIEANDVSDDDILSQQFRIDWAYYLVSGHQYIYGWIDRDREDDRKRHPSGVDNSRNHELVVAEEVDKYVTAIEYIKDHQRFINHKKMCIWGSNVAAFAALSALAASDILGCAVLITPVINWRLIDAVAYEYMFSNSVGHFYGDYGLRSDHFNLVNKMQKLISKHILIIHGSADDKVPIQHSMQLIRQLVSEYAKCDAIVGHQPLLQIQIYPDEDNTLLSVRPHIYQRIQHFLDQTFTHMVAHQTHDIKST